MIELKKINKTYNKGKENQCYVLKDIDLQIGDKEIVAIIGESGSGKTTLLNIIGCVDNFEKGDYLLNGISVAGLSEGKKAAVRNAQIGFVFQDFALVDQETVLFNTMLPMLLDKTTPIRSLKKEAKEALEKVNMEQYAKKKISQLSGGQKQRVAIARAILKKPAVILADEPTGALDSVTSEAIMDLFLELNKESSVIIVTHDEKVAYRTQRIIKIADGKILE